MLFPTPEFALFFLIVYAGHWTLRSRPALWKPFILAASYVFYGYWDWRFLGLIAASSIVNHATAVVLDRAGSNRLRKLLVVMSVAFNLGALGFFKYYGFFAVNAYQVCARLGIDCPLPLLDVILPVGISFFTFQAMSYVLDVYRRVIPPAPHLIDFAVYLAFFPQLVAGPIVRAQVLVPQVIVPPSPKRIDAGRAAILILSGLFKKVVIANHLAASIVDPVFDQPSVYGAVDVLFAVYGYAIQIYCDFSAYSDIAIGVALLMGFHFPINFDAPYLATSIQEFWRRWHISLSSWLRDYLYIPLGGSRGSAARTYRNLFLTFLLGGLWHGAGWTFIAWGFLHGLYLSVERLIRGTRATRPPPTGLRARLTMLAGGILTFHLVCLSWIFFRSVTFADAADMASALGRWSVPVMIRPSVLLALAAGFFAQFLDGSRIRKVWDAAGALPAWVLAALSALIMTAIFAMGPRGVAPFIYFQF